MERRQNQIQRLYQEEKQKCNSLSHINEELQSEKPVSKNQIKAANKQNCSQETSILKIKQPFIEALPSSKKKIEIKRLNLQKTSTNKEFDSENQIWNKLNDIINRIKFKKYIKAFLSLSRLRLQKHLTPSQIQQINDQSYWCDSYKEDKQKVENDGIQDNNKTSLLSFFKSIQIPIFLPHSLLYEIWTFVKITSAMICFFCYLVSFALNKDLEELFPIQLLVICQQCIFLDIFITLNTGIYIKGILCKNRRDLFNYYKSSKTIYYDICSTFFTTLYYLIHFNGFQHSQALMVLLLPIVFKHNDFYVIIKKLKQKFLLDRRAQNIIELINLLKNILVISHIFACIWLFVGLMSQQDYIESNTNANSQPSSWLELVNIINSPWYVQYLNSYYYITVTMSTVGYGDIRATNPIEVLVAVFFVMTCSVIFGFTLNNIGEIFQDFFQFEKQIQEKRYVIANYMNKNGINQQTRQSIFEYLEYYWKDQINENTQEENSIISQLSDNLKEELLIQSNRLIFRQNGVLREHFSPEILIKCLPIIQEMRFNQNEIIIDEQTGNSDCSIYFVLFGEVEVIHKQNNSLLNASTKQMKQSNSKYKEVSILTQGDQFGEKSFFTGMKQSLTFRSKQFSKVFKIKRDDFINILQGDQEQYEMFCSINDRLIFSSDQSFLKLLCKSCKDSSHDIVFCPYLHLIPRKLKLLSNIKNSEPHLERKAFKRRLYKQGALENNDLIQCSCNQFIENREDEIIQYENKYYTFRQFLGSKTYFISDEEADQIPRSLKESIKEKRATTTEFSESPQMNVSKKYNYNRRIGFILNNNQNNLYGNPNTKDQINYIQCNSLDDLQLNGVNLLTVTNKRTLSRDLDTAVRQNSESDIKFDFQSTQNSTSIIEKQIQQSRQQFYKMQILKEGNKVVQFDEKLGQEKVQEQKEKPQQSFYSLKQDYTDYDLFGGDFEKMAIFDQYFPKYNFKNVIAGLQQQKNHKYQMKDSINIPICKKINRNIQSIINRDREVGSCRSLPRMKMKAETPSSRENTIIKSQNNLSNQIVNFSHMTKFRISHQDSILINSQNDSNLDVVTEKQQSYEEPNTPPRNEYNISKQAINSLANFKTSQYNFGNIEDSQLVTIRKEYIQ